MKFRVCDVSILVVLGYEDWVSWKGWTMFMSVLRHFLDGAANLLVSQPEKHQAITYKLTLFHSPKRFPSNAGCCWPSGPGWLVWVACWPVAAGCWLAGYMLPAGQLLLPGWFCSSSSEANREQQKGEAVREIHRMRNPKAKVYPLPQVHKGGWKRAQRRLDSGIGDLQRWDLADAVPFFLIGCLQRDMQCPFGLPLQVQTMFVVCCC
jgi:hypothetical protein